MRVLTVSTASAKSVRKLSTTSTCCKVTQIWTLQRRGETSGKNGHRKKEDSFQPGMDTAETRRNSTKYGRCKNEEELLPETRTTKTRWTVTPLANICCASFQRHEDKKKNRSTGNFTNPNYRRFGERLAIRRR